MQPLNALFQNGFPVFSLIELEAVGAVYQTSPDLTATTIQESQRL